MRRALVAALCLALPGAALAQQARTQAQVAERELRPATALGDVLEVQIPDVASGRTQRRPVSDLMLRLNLVGGDLEQALRLPPGTAFDRAAGLFRVQAYVVSGGRLLATAEARCDRWIDQMTVCRVACDGGAFGLRRRAGQGRVALTLLVGQLPRGQEEGAKAGFSIDACEAGTAPEHIVSPAGNRATVEVMLQVP